MLRRCFHSPTLKESLYLKKNSLLRSVLRSQGSFRRIGRLRSTLPHMHRMTIKLLKYETVLSHHLLYSLLYNGIKFPIHMIMEYFYKAPEVLDKLH